MAKVRMKDMVILLPGITGSVLQKDGKDLWAVSGQAIWKALSSFGSSLEHLVLRHDDPNSLHSCDGITAPRVMPDVHLVPGLVKIDGYSATSRMITEQFEVIRGSFESDKAANFFEFPYDWRRDNRHSARRLQNLIRDHLPRWRKHSGASQAKVILLAHSMGGLVSRYYLEVLEGWRDCKALVTFGTPYRGSINALDFLANGYKQLFIDLTEAMRSFTSVYQLLPIYSAVNCNGSMLRVAEAEGIPNLDAERARGALAFHREIEEAVNRHLREPDYQDGGYKIVPVVGTRQPTLQSAALSGKCLTASRGLPPGLDELLGDGDGTVPYVSAIPIELSDEYRESYIPERHGSLQKQPQVLNDLHNRLRQMQIQGLGAIRGPEASPQMAERPAIALDLEDVYLPGEPLEFRARLVNSQGGTGSLKARVQPVAGGPAVEADFTGEEDGHVLRLGQLPPELYRIEVRPGTSGPQSPPPVHDVFEVAG